MSERWKRIEAIVHEALARPQAERQAYVQQACAADHAMRDEVVSLLAQESAAESFLAIPAVTLEPTMIGRTIGTYRIDARIGAGGMGVVYRARDTRLDRDVAVKILPAAVATDSGALARLGREARLLAALNHPRIAAIHGLEETAEVRALVLELLDGENLAQRLAHGPLSVPDACRLAAQIADGLAAAHDKGIVHRDLKPANVQITSGGNVKLLDFGIAKAVEGDAGGTTLATRQGAIIGTTAYMSPEQMRGEAVDRQADVWAFGCVLFEMLTGTQAFAGKTTSDIVAAVLEHEPSWSKLPANVPPQIRTLVRRCLAKDKGQRLRDMGDVRIALEEQPLLGSVESVRMARPSPERQIRGLAWIGAAVLVTAIIVGVSLWNRSVPAAPVPAGTTIKLWLPPGMAWAATGNGVPLLTRNGRKVAAVLTHAGASSIFVLDLGSGRWRELPGTENSRLALLSPDGTEVAFIRNNALMRTAIDSGATTKICDSGDDIRGGDWAEDGRIVLGIRGQGLAIVPSTGGVLTGITTPDSASSEDDHRYPKWLPGAKSIVFTVQRKNVSSTGIAVTTVGSARHRIVVRDGRSPALVDGYLIYVNDADELRAVAFDPASLSPGIQSVALGERPDSGERTSDTAVRTSSTDLVYVPYANALYHFELVDANGSSQRLPLPPQPLRNEVAVSRNGERFVFESGDGPQAVDLSLYDIKADSFRQLTSNQNSRFPVWADNDRIIYQQRHTGSRMLTLTLDAAGNPQGPPQATGEAGGFPMFVDGDTLLYGTPSDTNSDLQRLSLTGRNPINQLLERPHNQWGAALSPDRKWLAYVSDELGERFDVFITPYVLPLTPRRVVTGAQWIRWSRESNRLFYVQNGTLFAATVDASGALGTPVRVMAMPNDARDPGLPPYDTVPGGRLLVAVPEPLNEDARTPILVLNWTARLREALARK